MEGRTPVYDDSYTAVKVPFKKTGRFPILSDRLLHCSGSGLSEVCSIATNLESNRIIAGTDALISDIQHFHGLDIYFFCHKSYNHCLLPVFRHQMTNYFAIMIRKDSQV